MAEKTNLEKAAELLRQTATEYASIDVEKLLRRDLGSDGSFEALHENFLAFLSLSKRVSLCSWKGVPIDTIASCQAPLTEMQGIIRRILEFKPMRSGNPGGERSNIIDRFSQKWQEIYNIMMPNLCYAESVDSGADRYKEVMAAALAEANTAKENFQKSLMQQQTVMKADQERMQLLVAEVERMAKDAGVTNQAVHFKKLADRHLVGAGLCALVAGGFGWMLYKYVSSWSPVSAQSAYELAGVALPHLITVTLLSTALIFFVRNFSALMHNWVVNRHRQTALTTFKTFVNSTENPETKNAVLVQATQAIFAPQPSGYLKTDQEMPQMNQVTEIVRGVTGKEKG